MAEYYFVVFDVALLHPVLEGFWIKIHEINLGVLNDGLDIACFEHGTGAPEAVREIAMSSFVTRFATCTPTQWGSLVRNQAFFGLLHGFFSSMSVNNSIGVIRFAHRCYTLTMATMQLLARIQNIM